MTPKMKKILVICLILIMVASASVAVFAAPNGFLSSPSGRPGPTIVSFDPSNDECTAELIITPYGDRHTLPEALLALIERAYKEVVNNADDLTSLNGDFAKHVAKKKLSSKDLAVSDLFDVRPEGCDFHDGHYDFDITLAAESLEHFVGLLHMNKNGEWEFIDNARVTHNGDHLEFSVESLSPFAIVVDVSDGPQTGDNTMLYISLIMMIASAMALVFVLIKSKKQKA
jgi:LPXTG-motif cell wall-anchored protein